MGSNNKHLPRILCLHGGGTSAMIFSMQTRKLQHALRQHFRFVFIDGPFQTTAGPGVMPFFEGCGPFWRWVKTKGRSDIEVRQLLQKTLEEEGGPFVGVLGFSQGARLAAGILLEQQEKGQVEGREFRFAVCVNGTYPALILAAEPSSALRPILDAELTEWDEIYNLHIHLPSVHVHGEQDPYVRSSRLLARCFDPQTAKVFEFENGHHLPASTSDTEQVADEILKIYRRKEEDKSTSQAAEEEQSWF